MKVMIEAEIKPTPKHPSIAFQEPSFKVNCRGYWVAYWHRVEDGSFIAWVAGESREYPLPSEPAARAWVLEQLGAKEIGTAAGLVVGNSRPIEGVKP